MVSMMLLMCALSASAGPWPGWIAPEHPLSPWILHARLGDGPDGPSILPGEASPELRGRVPEGVYGYLSGTGIGSRARDAGGAGLLGLALTTAAEAVDSDGTQTRAGLALEACLEPVPGLRLHERLSVWASSDEEAPSGFTPFHEGVEQGRHLYVDWGYAAWEGGAFGASFGRIPRVWGPGRFTSLLLSNNSPPLDMLEVFWRPSRRFSFTGFTASVESDSATYLTAHRIDAAPFEWLEVGLSETILFRSAGLELAYMNPIVPWYPVQWNERDDDNAMMGIDATISPGGASALYCELLLDDIQYQTEWGRPNKIGWTLGATAQALGSAATLEYTRIDRYVYSQKLPRNYYLHHGDIIGSPLGPDCDRITLGLSSAAAWPVMIDLRLDHARHGEGTVYEGYPDSVQAGGPFPSGVVEHSTGARAGVSLYLGTGYEAHGFVSHRWVRNAGHVRGAAGDSTVFGLELLGRFGL